MTTRTKVLIGIGVIALGATTLAGASMADGRGHGRHHGGPGGPGARMMEQFDANQDGSVTQVEIDEVRTARFTEFDANGDGNLTLEEYQALWMDAMRERMVDRFQDLDDDGDAIVTTEEFVEPFGSMVNRMDRNDDGQLNREDRRRGGRDRDRDDDD
jgi:Ca2+-binding EF-hand superfamily protein